MYLKKYKKKNCPNGFLITAMQWTAPHEAALPIEGILRPSIGDYMGFDYKGDEFIMGRAAFEEVFEEVAEDRGPT